MKVLLVLACAVGALAGPAQLPAQPAFIGGYIIGGQEVDPPGKYPWMGSLEVFGSHYCGCVYLGDNNVLTAAHCTENFGVSQFRVRLGVHHRSDDSQGQPEAFGVIEKFEHDDYVSSAPWPNDVAILKLDDTPSDDNAFIELVNLPSSDDDWIGSECVISGWGRTSSSNVLPQELQEVDIDVIDNDDCQERMAGISGATILPTHICLYDSDENAGSCNGDSGGPLVCRNDEGVFELAGITSWGIQSGGNCLQSYPSVYGRVSEFVDWINDHL